MTGSAWQPIETAPKDGTDLLVTFLPPVVDESWWTTTAYWHDEWEKWATSLGGEEVEPTHWMPLPDPPALAAAAVGGDVKQAPGEDPQSGPATQGNAQNDTSESTNGQR